MEEYPFAYLDENDLNALRSLESKLTGKYGKHIILIAYEQSDAQDSTQGLSAWANDDDDPERYGVLQVTRETGYDSQ